MIRARMLFIASIACAVAAGPAAAGIERAGTTAANFLALGSGPGVLAMGGAGLGLEGGLAAFDWNPATLAHIGRTEAVFSHASLGESNAQEWAGVGSRLRFGGLSGAVTGLFQHEGSFEGRDALNNPTGSFDVSSVAVGAGIARAIGPLVTAGLGIKYAGENLGGVRGSGVAFDAGVQVRSAGFGFGMAAQNAFGKMKYDAASYDFPASFGLGVSYEHAASGLRVALDMNFPAAYYNDIRGGLEWRWNERFALRTGYRAELGAASGEPLGGPTFGMGAGAGSMWFDYGYLVGGGVGQHRIGITFRPGSTALPPDGPEHRGRELEHASTDALPRTDKPESAPVKPRASAPESAPAAASTPATSSAPAAPARPVPVAAPPASATPPASTSARTVPSAAPPASATPPASTSARPAPSAAPPSSATPPASTSARPAPSAAPPASATPPASTSARTVPSAAPPASATPPASTSARPVPVAAPPASPSSSASPRASAPAGVAATAAGPLAAQAPPSYTQRAKAARGTGEASANDRASAALAPPASSPPRPPVAPPASTAAPATAKRDSTAAPKSGPAPATTGPGTSAPAAAARSDSAKAGSPAPIPGPRPEKVRVRSGQTMGDIARAYGTSVPAIMMENNLVTDQVRAGQVLKLPRR